MASGGKTSPLKAVPEDNTGLKKLTTPVRNKMGYMKSGGRVKSTSCPVDGVAKRGKTRIRKKGK